MKIKLVAAGFETYTGTFGPIEFLNGVSVGEVSAVDAQFMAAILSVETIEGDDPGLGAQFNSSKNVAAACTTLPTIAELQSRGEWPSDEEIAAKKAEDRAEAQKKAAEVVKGFTKDALEKVADTEGIAGLRKIGDAMGVKGSSIAKLIDLILSAQSAPVPEAAPLAEGQPDVVTSENAE